jgi:adenine-specific DNA-methyltransferase
MYTSYFERLINHVFFKGKLLKSYYDDYEVFQNIIANCHESLINFLIVKLLCETKNWDSTLLKMVFPVSHHFEAEFKDLDKIFLERLSYSSIEAFHISFLNSQILFNNEQFYIKAAKNQSKFNGAFYTSNEVVLKMCQDSFEALPYVSKNSNFKALDFASGTGNFYFEIVKKTSFYLGKTLKECAINNVFAFDKDNVALSILKMKSAYILNLKQLEDLTLISRNIFHLDFIDYSIENTQRNKVDLFNPIVNGLGQLKFDLIISNPPYLNLKYNKPSKSLLPESAHSYYLKYIKSTVEKVRNSYSFPNSSSGMINLYRLSTDLMLSMLNSNGVVTIICPSSLFADKTALPIRKEILVNFDLFSITYFREDTNLFEGVTQSTVIFCAKKTSANPIIKVKNGDRTFNVPKSLIFDCFPNTLEIPLVDEIGWAIIAKLNLFPKIASLSFIRNKRGELDLTLHKQFITTENTSYQLVRGNRLKKNYIFREHQEFVNIEAFKKVKSKDYINNDFEKNRLVCNQISNLDRKNRLRFIISEPTDIIANSCNYLTFSDPDTPVDFYLNQLNSPVLNWFFKTISSNNHVNNYELDALPILNHKQLDNDSIKAIQSGNINEIFKSFSLTNEEVNYLQLD